MLLQKIGSSIQNLMANKNINTLESLKRVLQQHNMSLAGLVNYWDSYLLPLLQSLPQSKDGVNPFSNGLDAANMYVDKDAKEGDPYYWNTTAGRPYTIKEILDSLR